VEVSDSKGVTDVDFGAAPDGSGTIIASALMFLPIELVAINLNSEELYGHENVTIPIDGWASATPYGMMFTSYPKTSENAIYDTENANNGGFGIGSNYFNISHTIPGSKDSINMFFLFDYKVDLIGQAEPGAPCYSDASVSMLLQYEDTFRDLQLVSGGQLYFGNFR
jgi:hypothetical protein